MHGRVHMKPQREIVAAAPGKRFLAHQLVAVGTEEQAAAMDQAECLLIAIVANVQPLEKGDIKVERKEAYNKIIEDEIIANHYKILTYLATSNDNFYRAK